MRAALLLTLALGGCHLVLPLSSSSSDHGQDGPRVDASTDAPRIDAAVDGRRDRPGDAGATDLSRTDGRPADRAGDASVKPDLTALPPGAICTGRWCWESPLPTGNDLNAVWGTSATDVFAVGDLGTIVHFDGLTLSSMHSGTKANLWGVWGTSSTNVYAVGEGGTILQWDGTNWSSVLVAGVTETLWHVWASGTSVYAVGNDGRLVQHGPSGWTTSKLGAQHLYGVWGRGNEVIAVGAAGTICQFDGVTWYFKTVGSDDLYSVWGTNSFVIAVGDKGAVVELVGTSTSMTNHGTVPLNGVAGDGSMTVTVRGQGGNIYSYTIGGTWPPPQTPPPAVNLEGVWASSGGSGVTFAVGAGGLVLSRPLTGSWALATKKPAPYDLYGALAQSGVVAAAGDNGSLLVRKQWADWSSLSTGVVGTWLEGLWLLDSTHLLAVGQNGVALSCPVGSAGACTKIGPSTTDWLENAWAMGGEVYVVGGNWYAASNGGSVRRYNAGWSSVAASAEYLHGVWASGSTVYVVGKKGTIQSCTAASCTAMTSNTNVNLWSIWGDSSTGQMYAVGENGTILRYSGSWQPDTTTFPSVTFWDVCGCNSGEVFAVGTSGTIARRTSTTSWLGQDSGTINDLLGVACDGANHAYAVGQYGTILHRFP